MPKLVSSLWEAVGHRRSGSYNPLCVCVLGEPGGGGGHCLHEGRLPLAGLDHHSLN